MSKADGMNYAPKGKPNKVVEDGQFVIAAVSLDHGHIYGMCNGLIEAGATIKWVYDHDPARVAAFIKQYPQVQAADSEEQVLTDPEVQLVAAAAITSERGPLGVRVMRSGKHYFTDKAPFTTLEQLADARTAYAETGKKYAVYYSERLHVESAVFAGELIERGAIGRVVQVIGLGPHRLNAASRPAWFLKRKSMAALFVTLVRIKSNSFYILQEIATETS